LNINFINAIIAANNQNAHGQAGDFGVMIKMVTKTFISLRLPRIAVIIGCLWDGMPLGWDAFGMGCHCHGPLKKNKMKSVSKGSF